MKSALNVVSITFLADLLPSMIFINGHIINIPNLCAVSLISSINFLMCWTAFITVTRMFSASVSTKACCKNVLKYISHKKSDRATQAVPSILIPFKMGHKCVTTAIMCPSAPVDFITFIVLSIVNDKTVLQVTTLYTLSCQCLLQMVSTKLSTNVTLPKAIQTPIMYLYTRKSSTILVGEHNNHVTAYLMVLVTSIILAYKTHDRPWSGLQCLAVIFQTCKFSNM